MPALRIDAHAAARDLLRRAHDGRGETVRERLPRKARLVEHDPRTPPRLVIRRIRRRSALEQRQRPHPVAVQRRGQPCKRPLDGNVIAQLPRIRLRGLLRCRCHGVPEFVQPTSAARCHADDRRAHPRGKPREVDLNPLLLRLVQEVHAQHHPRRPLPDLQRESETAAQTRRVRHDDNHPRPAAREKVPRNLLLRRVCRERVRSRQVDEPETPLPPYILSLRQRHGLARPVAGVLVQAGQSIEYRGFAHVRVPREGDHRLLHVPSLLPRCISRHSMSPPPCACRVHKLFTGKRAARA